MTENTPPTEFGPIAEGLLPPTTRRAIHALWQAEGSRQYIDSVVTETDVYVGNIDTNLSNARTAYEYAMGAFTGEEVCVLADQLDAKEQAVDHLRTTPDDIPTTADALATLLKEALFIATESAGDGFQQRIHEADTIREESQSMVGGVTITADALQNIIEYHPNVDSSETCLPL